MEGVGRHQAAIQQLRPGGHRMRQGRLRASRLLSDPVRVWEAPFLVM
jgi:hypothetical protein